ncbi:hypothetical protein [Haladaptatus caseinilyticus]|nr:hypothetical protein [Haladaptatus caseinilyticus]
MIATETNGNEPTTTTVTHETEEETPRRRSFSLRALLPGPYVRYPK